MEGPGTKPSTWPSKDSPSYQYRHSHCFSYSSHATWLSEDSLSYQHRHSHYCPIRSASKQKEKEVDSLSHRVAEMEEQLRLTRSALEEKDEELKSFKDRLAGVVALSMKTGKGVESMNSPVSRSRLKEMYEDLWLEWPEVKNQLKSSQQRPESVKALIQDKFKDAVKEMEEKKQQIDEVFGLKESSSGSEKVQQYRRSAVQSLQLAVFHSRKEDADSQTPSSEAPPGVVDRWLSECYWLGCLMALNEPPLRPDWENHNPERGRWDFFPRNIAAYSGKKTKQIQNQDPESMTF